MSWRCACECLGDAPAIAGRLRGRMDKRSPLRSRRTACVTFEGILRWQGRGAAWPEAGDLLFASWAAQKGLITIN